MKISVARRGKKAWNNGVPMREETKIKLARTMFQPGIVPWNKGGTHSLESLEKMRQAQLGRKQSDETKAKMRLAQQARRSREAAV